MRLFPIHVAGVCGASGQVGEAVADTNLDQSSVEFDDGLHSVAKHEDWIVDGNGASAAWSTTLMKLFTSVETISASNLGV